MIIDDAVLTDYALGTLPAEQIEEVERFLRSHPEAAGQVRRIQDDLAGLVLSLPAETVIQDSEDALVERLRGHDRPPVRQTAGPEPRTRLNPRWAALGLAAALGIAAWLALGPLNNSRQLERELAGYQARPGAITTSLVTEDGDRLGTLVRLRDNRLFVAFDESPAEGVYQLWEIRDDAIESLAVVTRRSLLTEPVAEGSVFGVTLEPPGGSPQPTSEPLVLVPI